jgi:ribosomal protein L32
MRCSACGRDNLESFKFCSECGGALRQERVCPSCETVNPVERTSCSVRLLR